MKHYMKLNPRPFDLIKSGQKTIELRLYDDKRSLVNIGDTIEFTNLSDNSEKLSVKVIALHRFSSFDELYAKLPLLKCGYTDETVSSASPNDMLNYYSREQQGKYGVVGIEIELI